MGVKDNLPEVQNTLLKVQSTVENLPLDSILVTAEMVAGFLPIPYIDKVIKLLRILIKWRPVANNLLGVSSQAVGFFQNPNNGNIQNNENTVKNSDEMMTAMDREEIMAMLDQIIDIAAEDGDLSPEEEQCLLDVVRQAGVNEQMVLAKVKMKCISNNNK